MATFFGLWLSVYLPLEFELFLSYVLIISFGILHGANDVEVLTSYFHKREISMSKVSLTLLYILLIATIYAIFYVFPAIALLLFVVFSGYHFGEQHWSGTLKRQLKGKSLFYTLYGALILFMLFYSHIPQVGGLLRILQETVYLLIFLVKFSWGWAYPWDCFCCISVVLVARGVLFCWSCFFWECFM